MWVGQMELCILGVGHQSDRRELVLTKDLPQAHGRRAADFFLEPTVS